MKLYCSKHINPIIESAGYKKLCIVMSCSVNNEITVTLYEHAYTGVSHIIDADDEFRTYCAVAYGVTLWPISESDYETLIRDGVVCAEYDITFDLAWQSQRKYGLESLINS